MPDILPTINNEPPQGIQALLDTVYLWNPDVANDLIEKINELLKSIDNVSGKIPPYSELEAPILQYMPCYDGDNVYVAAQDLDELPGTLNPSQWILIATKAPVLQAGTGISIDGNEISVTQAISDGAAAGSTAVQPGDLGTAAYAATTDFATATQGSLADSAVQPGDLGTAAYASTSDFATATQGGKADTAVQPGDLGTAAYAATTDFATAAQGQLADSAIQASDLGTAAYAASTDFATASQGAKADTAIQSVKTINGNDIVGTGNLVITSFAVYPASWPTTGTTKAFCDAIAADDTAVEGMTYLGEVTLTDMPNGIANSEIQVEIMSGSSAYNKVILLTLTSGNVAPYRWQYTYWNAGSNVSGWINIGQQVNVDWNSSSGVTQILNKPAIPTVVDDYNSTSGTAALSANMGHDLNQRLTSVEGRGRFLSTWNCTTGLAGTNPPTSPYTYKSGDYFIVSTVGATNYRPSGSQYVTGTASSVVETGSVAVNDTYQYDGTNWVLLKNTVEDPLPSQTGNNGKYLTTDGTAASWAAISFPVSSVNSQTGAVTLTATDVGALPSSTVIPSTAIDVNAVPQLSTLPTADLAHEGQVVQFVGTTGTYTNGYFYKCVSDGDVSNPTFSWVRVDVQPAPVIPDPLPSQTGNSGKFLTTNGTAASWDKAIPNKATGTGSYSVGSSTNSYVTAIGASQTVDVLRATAFGAENRIYDNESTAIGDYIQIWGSRSFGAGVDVIIDGYSSIAIGPAAQARANVAIQLGGGTNSTANSMQVWTYQLLSKTTGLIPEARLADTTNATAGQALVLDSNLKAAWTTVDSLPAQSGQSGKYLTTNGTTASWAVVDVIQVSTMPTAAAGEVGKVYQFIGTTDANYTHGYFYECVASAATAVCEQTYGSGLTDISVTNTATFASAFETAFDAAIGSTTVEFEYDDSVWMVSAEIEGQTETVFDQDITSWAVTFTGTPQTGDTISVAYTDGSYAWSQVNVQPSATKHKYTVTLEMIQGETMTAAFYMRGAEGKTTNLNITQFISYEDGGVWDDPYFDGQYIGFLKSGADGISASKIVALNTETNNIGFDVRAIDDNNEPVIEFVADYPTSYAAPDSVRVVFEIESDEPLVEVETSEAGAYSGDNCITQAVPYLSLIAPSGDDQDYVLQNKNGEQLSWVAAPTGLPSQTGNSGKFLTTDGTDASWSSKPLTNVSENAGSLVLLGTDKTYSGNSGNIVIGTGATATGSNGRNIKDMVVIGTDAKSLNDSSSSGGVVIGKSASIYFGASTAIGVESYSYDVGVGLGWKARSTASYAIQIGRGTNSTANTFSVGLSASNNYQLLDSNGTIPEARLADTTSATQGQALVLDSNLNAIWSTVESLPSQSGQSGKYLTTNGTTASWATVEALPSQSGNSGKLLTTNGTTASWDTKANLGLSGVTLRTWGANE